MAPKVTATGALSLSANGPKKSDHPGMGRLARIRNRLPEIVNGSVSVIPFLTATKILFSPILIKIGTSLFSINLIIFFLHNK